MESSNNLASGYETREYVWVKKVINTCDHPIQLHMCNALIDLLKKKQNDVETNVNIQKEFHNKAVMLEYYEYKAKIDIDTLQ